MTRTTRATRIRARTTTRTTTSPPFPSDPLLSRVLCLDAAERPLTRTPRPPDPQTLSRPVPQSPVPSHPTPSPPPPPGAASALLEFDARGWGVRRPQCPCDGTRAGSDSDATRKSSPSTTNRRTWKISGHFGRSGSFFPLLRGRATVPAGARRAHSSAKAQAARGSARDATIARFLETRGANLSCNEERWGCAGVCVGLRPSPAALPAFPTPRPPRGEAWRKAWRGKGLRRRGQRERGLA